MAEGDKVAGQVPYALAMLIADAVYVDPATRKKSVLGIFNTYEAAEFPATVAKLAIYIAVTDGRGTCPISIKLVDAAEERAPIFEEGGELNFSDPRAVYELVMLLENVAFPEPGEYRFQFYSHGEYIMERRIILEET